MPSSLPRDAAYRSLPIRQDFESDVEYSDEETSATMSDSEDVEDSMEDAGKSSIFSAMMNLISNRLQTPGLLALPLLIQHGGVAALLVLVLVPCVCVYTGKILIDCMYDTRDGKHKRIRSTYKDLGTACWSKHGGRVVVVTQILQVGLMASFYFAFGASLLMDCHKDFPISKATVMVLTGLVCLPMVYLKKFSRVSWVSLLAIISLLVSIAVIMRYCHVNLMQEKTWKAEEIDVWYFNWVPLALNIVTLSSSHGILPTLESSLNDKSQFNKVLGMTYALSMFVMLLFSLIVFFAFHHNLEIFILYSLPIGNLSIVIEVFLFLNSVLCFPFIALVLMNIIESSLIPLSIDMDSIWPSYNVLRAGLVLLVLFPALAFPHFKELIAFVGSYTNICITFIFPCVFHLKLKRSEIPFYQVVFNYLIIFGGVCVGITGIIFAGKKLIEVNFLTPSSNL